MSTIPTLIYHVVLSWVGLGWVRVEHRPKRDTLPFESLCYTRTLIAYLCSSVCVRKYRVPGDEDAAIRFSRVGGVLQVGGRVWRP